eukprot:364409-Chlamydomonas_euryale.AAC.1
METNQSVSPPALPGQAGCAVAQPRCRRACAIPTTKPKTNQRTNLPSCPPRSCWPRCSAATPPSCALRRWGRFTRACTMRSWFRSTPTAVQTSPARFQRCGMRATVR